MEKNTTVITLDKFNYHRPSNNRCSVSTSLSTLRQVERKRLAEKKLAVHPSNVSRGSLNAFRKTVREGSF